MIHTHTRTHTHTHTHTHNIIFIGEADVAQLLVWHGSVQAALTVRAELTQKETRIWDRLVALLDECKA